MMPAPGNVDDGASRRGDTVVDGERKVIEPPHPDKESADAVAAVHAGCIDRFTDAAEVASAEERPTAP